MPRARLALYVGECRCARSGGQAPRSARQRFEALPDQYLDAGRSLTREQLRKDKMRKELADQLQLSLGVGSRRQLSRLRLNGTTQPPLGSRPRTTPGFFYLMSLR
jgi:hypothetical protein